MLTKKSTRSCNKKEPEYILIDKREASDDMNERVESSYIYIYNFQAQGDRIGRVKRCCEINILHQWK